MRIGETLAEARGRAGLTVAEVSQRTRVRQLIIRAIEADDYSVCGGDFYARGHIRSIAKAVGIDPEPLIKEYDAVHRAPGALSAVSMDELAAAAQTAEMPAAGQAAAAARRAMGEQMTAATRRTRELSASAAARRAKGASAAAAATRAISAEVAGNARRALSAGRALQASRAARARPRRAAGSGSAAGSRWPAWASMGTPRRPGPNWVVALGVVLVLAFGLGGYFLISGTSPGQAPAAAPPPAGSAAASHRHSTQPGGGPAPQGSASPAAPSASPHGTPAASAPPPVPVRTLNPVSVAAFGPGGRGQGDNGELAHLATDSSSGTAWHSDWYTSATFGNLYSGTGLLLDMGHPVTITGARIDLGNSSGGRFELRVGPAPSLGSLTPVADRRDAAGAVAIRLLKPAHGRYVLIWFTRLPADASGSYQAAVHDVVLRGQR